MVSMSLLDAWCLGRLCGDKPLDHHLKENETCPLPESIAAQFGAVVPVCMIMHLRSLVHQE